MTFLIDSLHWKQLQLSGDIPQKNRFGHSLLTYKRNHLILFGGQEDYEQNQPKSKDSKKDCLNDLRMINLETMEWKIARSTGEYVYPRRNHAACVVGKHMIVHGGIDIRESYLKDMFLYDISN